MLLFSDTVKTVTYKTICTLSSGFELTRIFATFLCVQKEINITIQLVDLSESYITFIPLSSWAWFQWKPPLYK